MPQVERASLKQYAVLWTKVSYDRYGQPKLTDSPEELRVRWQVKRTEVLDKNGNSITLEGTATVTKDIPIGSLMWLGRLKDWPEGVPPQENGTEVMEVKTYNDTPDIKGRSSYREVGLMRYQEALPT